MTTNKPFTTQDALTILQQHQAWRRGEREDMDHPMRIGQAIDVAISAMQAQAWRPIEEAPRDGTGFTYFQRVSRDIWWIGTAVYMDGCFCAVNFWGEHHEIIPSHFKPLCDESEHPDLPLPPAPEATK